MKIYVYIHIHIYVCVYILAQKYIYVNIYIYVYTHTHIHILLYSDPKIVFECTETHSIVLGERWFDQEFIGNVSPVYPYFPQITQTHLLIVLCAFKCNHFY